MAVQNTTKKDSGASSAQLPKGRDPAASARSGTAAMTSTGSTSSSAPSSKSRRSPGSRRPLAGRSTGPAADPSSNRSSTAPYRYMVLPGNESVLLREALERRPWWQPVPSTAAGDRGAPAAAGAQKQQQQQQKWNLWAGLNGQKFTQFDLLLPGGSAGAAAGSTDPSSRRLVNRLQEHRLVCTKSGLAGVLASIKTAAGDGATRGGGGGAAEPSAGASSAAESDPTGSRSGSRSESGSKLDTSWIPETYVVPAGAKAVAAGGPALSRFKAAFARHAAAGRHVWIAKPTCLNRGNGIEVFSSLDRIMEHLKSRPAGGSLILQKYIERPMLLGGRKFDIRAYVLVAPDGSVYFHKEAYVRTSSTMYDSSDLGNRASHLTNDAVQKHLDSYHTFEDHCKLSLEDLGPALRRASDPSPTSSGSPAFDSATSATSATSAEALKILDTAPGCETGLWGAMRRCVAALFSVAGPGLNPRRLGHCFELLGLDFMLDADGGLYLIEVNTSPALFRAGTYLADLLPRLVEEVVQKVVDPLFPPPPLSQPGQPQDVDEAEPSPSAAAAPSPPPRLPPLDGFVRVELDEQLAIAAAGLAAGKAGSATRRASSPGPGGGAGAGAGRGLPGPSVGSRNGGGPEVRTAGIAAAAAATATGGRITGVALGGRTADAGHAASGRIRVPRLSAK